MSFFDRRTVSIFSTLVLFLLVAGFIYAARRVLIVFLFAILFAYLLEPLVSLVERKSKLSRGSRSLAILQVYLILLVIISGVLLGIGPRVADEGRKFMSALPGLLDQVSSGRIVTQLGGRHGWSFDTQTRIQQFFVAHRGAINEWATDFASRVTMLLANAVWLIVIPILAIFFLRDGRELADSVIQMAEPSRQRQFLSSIVEDLNLMLAGYIRAQLILAALSLVVYIVVLLLLRVPYAIILGLVGGAMEFIPVAGPLVAALLIFGVAYLTGYHHLLFIALFFVVWRLVQDYVNSPRIMGGKLKLHPLAALFAVLAGGEIAGVIGVYLSVPIIATLRIVWRRWQTYSETDSVVKDYK